MLTPWVAVFVFFSLLGLLIGSQFFWFWQVRKLVRAQRRRWLRWTLGLPLYGWFLLLGTLFLLIPLRLFFGPGPVLLGLVSQVRRPEVMVPLGLWIGASMFAFLFILLVQGSGRLLGWLGRTARKLRTGVPETVPERRHFLQTASYAAGALPFVATGYGFLIARTRYAVQETDVPVANLPPALDGLRLLQLTDVHASAFLPPPEVRRVVDMAREVKADLVFHTGDFITSAGDPLEETVGELARAEGRYGTFGCLGNHEIYAGVTDLATELFARQGVRILRSQRAEVEVGDARLNLIGVDYERQPRGVERPDWKEYFLPGVQELVRPEQVNLLLSHNPNPFLRAVDLGIDLTLAGHTHGGQVRVEILGRRWSPARFMTPFISGLFERQGRRLYVSRGIGTIFAPVRLNAPPEITLLTLRRAV